MPDPLPGPNSLPGPRPGNAAAPPVARTTAALEAKVSGWRGAGQSVGLVPTMGALHEGHLSLIRRLRDEADRIVVSIFVNPTQFGANEDFDSYPRDEGGDLGKIAAAGADLVYLPMVADIYPQGTSATIAAGPMAGVLCGASRPGHFDGVASVVERLFALCKPDLAIFGEKDFQQLLVIRHMTAQLKLPVRILGAPIVRETDGLALSSRNRYLDARNRKKAAALPAVLRRLAERAGAGEEFGELEAEGRERLLAAGFTRVDYLEFRDEATLAKAATAGGKVRLFAAAVIGGARLIDNIAVPEDPESRP